MSASRKRNIKATISPLDLPDNTVLTGQATKHRGYDARGESNGEDVVLDFRRQSLAELLEQLDQVAFDRLIIERLYF